MGLLDWLTDSIGGRMGEGGGLGLPSGPLPDAKQPFIGATNNYSSPGGQPDMPMPPVQQTGMDAPPQLPGNFNFGQMPIRPPAADGMPAPPSAGMMTPPNPNADGMSLPPGMGPPISADGMPAPNSMGGAPGLPPGIPLPRPRPEAANPPTDISSGNITPNNRFVPNQPPLPPMTRGEGQGIVNSYERAGGNAFAPAAPDGAGTAKTIIGRALGLDGNRESQIRGALGAGFKAAGESAGKSPMQAFASGAGAGIEGGKGADDTTTKQQDQYLGRKIQSKGVENAELNSASTRELNMARTKLALEQAKMVKEGGGFTGKAGTANSPQQLYLSGLTRVNNDPEIKLAKSTYDNLLKQYPPDAPEVKAAAEAHKKLVEAKRTEILGSVGLKPEEIAKIGKQPGMSQDNPVPKAGLTKEKFDALPPGAYFINPKDGRLLMKKGPAAPAAGGNQPVAPQQSMTPAMPPVPPVTAPAGSRADNPDDYE
jgi:hypothetical protein